MTRIYVSAGEPSGDAHAGLMVRELRRLLPDAGLEGMGGHAMRQAGVTINQPIDQLCTMGLTEVVGRLPSHVRHLFQLRRHFRDGRYQLVVLVDYPEFHLPVARMASAAGIPVLYYVAPQLWAWRPGRAAALRRYIQRLAVILPFEEAFFAERGVATTFVGHPLLDRGPGPNRDAARGQLGIGFNEPVLAVFPGSRRHEVNRHWPVFREAAKRVVSSRPQTRVVIASVPGLEYPGSEPFTTVWNNPALIFAAADAGLCKSGTTTLEAALAGMPLVIAYRLSAVSYAVARRLVRIRQIGLVNLVAGRAVAPEFIQHHATPEALAGTLLPLLDGSGQADLQRVEFGEIRQRLGEPGASRRVAQMAQALVA